MASAEEIDEAHEGFAAAFNRGHQWRTSTRLLWHATFMETHHDALVGGVHQICITAYDFPPNFGQVVAAVRKNSVDLGHSKTHIKKRWKHILCPDCIMHGGFVDTAAHYTWVAPSRTSGRNPDNGFYEPAMEQGKYYVPPQKRCICTCDGGVERATKKPNGETELRTWREREYALAIDDRIDLHVFYETNRRRPTLMHEHRMRNHEWHELERRVKEGKAADRGFHRHLRLMVEGGAAMGEHLTGKREDPNND